MARAAFEQSDCNVFQAWRKVTLQRPAATALHAAVARLGVMNGTTSGVEQTFAKQFRAEALWIMQEGAIWESMSLWGGSRAKGLGIFLCRDYLLLSPFLDASL